MSENIREVKILEDKKRSYYSCLENPMKREERTWRVENDALCTEQIWEEVGRLRGCGRRRVCDLVEHSCHDVNYREILCHRRCSVVQAAVLSFTTCVSENFLLCVYIPQLATKATHIKPASYRMAIERSWWNIYNYFPLVWN